MNCRLVNFRTTTLFIVVQQKSFIPIIAVTEKMDIKLRKKIGNVSKLHVQKTTKEQKTVDMTEGHQQVFGIESIYISSLFHINLIEHTCIFERGCIGLAFGHKL